MPGRAGRGGRPPKPVEQKRRTGNPGKRRLPNGTQLVAVAPVQRGPLDLRADEIFDRVLGDGIEWLSESDGPRIVLLREQLEERQALRDAVLAGTGDRKQLRELEKAIAEGLSALGFDPAARSRLGLAEVKRVSKLQELRNKASKSAGAKKAK